MKFNDMPYQRPDMKDVKSHFEKVKNDIKKYCNKQGFKYYIAKSIELNIE